MKNQSGKVMTFAALHVKGAPLVLHNIWDAGSAKAVADAGAKAIATGSWAVAAAQGFGDGQALPLADMVCITGQIVASVDVPVTADFEGGYATSPDYVAENLRMLLDTGIIGINLEDQVVGGAGLHGAADQAHRISALRKAANAAGINLFINARTEVFFHKGAAPHTDGQEDAAARAKIYADAGADGVLVPGLADADLINEFCAAQPFPVNIMRMGETLNVATLAACGVGRISNGPGPYIASMQALGDMVREA